MNILIVGIESEIGLALLKEFDLTQLLVKELPTWMTAVALNPYFVSTELLESCKKLFLLGEYNFE